MKEIIAIGDSCEILKGKTRWNNREVILKRYYSTSDVPVKDIKTVINELTTFQVMKSNHRFVQLIAVFKDEECLYIAMEKINGVNLNK